MQLQKGWPVGQQVFNIGQIPGHLAAVVAVAAAASSLGQQVFYVGESPGHVGAVVSAAAVDDDDQGDGAGRGLHNHLKAFVSRKEHP